MYTLTLDCIIIRPRPIGVRKISVGGGQDFTSHRKNTSEVSTRSYVGCYTHSVYWRYTISPAFDVVDHTILLQGLETWCGFKGLLLQWFLSYLSDRTEMVISGDSRTQWVPVKLGVSQGSVLGTLLFILYTAASPLSFSIRGASLLQVTSSGRALCWSYPGVCQWTSLLITSYWVYWSSLDLMICIPGCLTIASPLTRPKFNLSLFGLALLTSFRNLTLLCFLKGFRILPSSLSFAILEWHLTTGAPTVLLNRATTFVNPALCPSIAKHKWNATVRIFWGPMGKVQLSKRVMYLTVL